MKFTLFRLSNFSLRFVAVCLLILQSAQASGIDVVDDRNVRVHFNQAPLRIVSVLPSLTESVCALGHCQRLVGVDRYSNFPASLANLPRVGGSLDPSIEAIAALKPDVVLMSVASRAAERLQALGIKVLAMEPKTHADVRRILSKLAHMLDVNEVDTIWQEMNRGIDEAARSLPSSVKKVRVYFEVSNAPYAAGESSFIGETLLRLGAGNIVGAALGPFPKLNPEFVVRENPDLIMISERGFAGLAARPGWQIIKAMREGRVCTFTSAETDVLVRPGPRMAEAAWIMARCLKSQLKSQLKNQSR